MSEEVKVFLAPKLTGARFDDHTLPVKILEDFKALEELIIELAKKNYLEENPTRKRVPKGFADGFYLKLSDIEEGSTIPKFLIASVIAGSTLLPNNATESYRYIEQARDKVIDIIGDASNGLTIELDHKYLNYFNRIGKNLLPDEAINFTHNTPNAVKVAILNKSSRKIILSSQEKSEYSEPVLVNALISQMDKKNNFITFEIEDQTVRCALDSDFSETISTAFNEYEKNTLVSLKAIGVYNYQEKLIRIEEIESMDVLDPFDVSVRLSQLGKLEDSWYEGHGKAPNSEFLEKFGNLFKLSYNPKLPLPAIFPTTEGNIQLEWVNGKDEIILEVNLSNLTSNFFSFNHSTDEETEQQLDLASENNWTTLNELIAMHF